MSGTSERDLWETLLRGLWTGLVYGIAYNAAELAGTAILLEWLGVSAAILNVLRLELASLMIQYALFGAILGLIVALPARWLEARLPRRWKGPGIHFMLLAFLFIAIAFFWNGESILPRRAYVFSAFGAQAVILIAGLLWKLGKLLVRVTPLHRLATLPVGSRRFVLAGLIVAAGVVIYTTLKPPPPHSDVADLEEAETHRPNIVLIVLDTLRRDHLPIYGYHRKVSETIDRIAKEGVVYDRAFSTAPWTLPAHASLFTGLYTVGHETDNGSIRLGKAKRTMAEILSDHGYRTGGFSANPWLSPISGLEQGFERFDYLGTQTTTSAFFLNLVKERFRELALNSSHQDLGGDVVTTYLLRWMDSVRRTGSPFFIFVNYMEVHEPYGTVPEPYFSAYLERPLPSDIGRVWVRETPLFLCSTCPPESAQIEPGSLGVLSCNDGRWHIPPDRLEATVALYDAGILYLDHQIQRIYDALDEAGILDDTLLIVTSDHGESLGERGQIGHGALLYNSVLEVPLVMRYPGTFPPGTRVSESVSLVDILPTVEEVLGLPRSPLRDAVSLVPGEELAARPDRVLCEYYPVEEHVWKAVGRRLKCDYHLAGRYSASLQEGPVKYIWSSTGDHELYELDSDPTEENNLIETLPLQARDLDAELKEWRDAIRPRISTAETYELDPATKDALESLGYAR